MGALTSAIGSIGGAVNKVGKGAVGAINKVGKGAIGGVNQVGGAIGLPGLKKQPTKPLTAQTALGQQPAQSTVQRMMPQFGQLRGHAMQQAAMAAQPQLQQPQQLPGQQNYPSPTEEEPT